MKVIRLSAFVVLAISAACRAEDRTYSNLFGGRDYYRNGRYVSSQWANLIGGFDFYNGNNQYLGRSAGNLFGGFDYQFTPAVRERSSGSLFDRNDSFSMPFFAW